MRKQNDEISIKDLIALFIPKLWIVVLCAVVLSLILGGYAMFIKNDSYTSKSSVMVSKRTSTSVSSNDMELATDFIETLEFMLYSDSFLAKVANDIKENPEYSDKGWNITPDYIGRSMIISPNGDTPTFEIKVTTSDKELSYAICGAVSTRVLDGTLIEDNILPNMFGVFVISPIDPPARAKGANDKGILTNTIVGFLVGAVISMVVIYILAMFDVVIHDRKKIEDNFDIPVLGVIPRYDVSVEKSEGGEA